MKRAVITGGLGFIGKNFAKNIRNIYDEIIIVDKKSDHSDLAFYRSELSNNAKLEISTIANFDFSTVSCDNLHIYNFAAESHVDRSFKDSLDFSKNNYLETHIMLNNLIEQKFNFKLLHISTDEVYGESNEQGFNETSPMAPTNPYAASKAAADLLVQTYIKCFDLNAKIVRPNNAFGHRQHFEKLIPKLFYCLAKDEEFFLHNGGRMKRSFLHTDDLSEALLSIITHWNSPHKIFNLRSEAELSVIEVIETVERIVGKKLEINHSGKFDRLYNDQEYKVTDEPIRSLGWRQECTFEKELENLFNLGTTYFK